MKLKDVVPNLIVSDIERSCGFVVIFAQRIG